MSYADDYEEQSYLNPGLEHAIDEEYADFSGSGLRVMHKEIRRIDVEGIRKTYPSAFENIIIHRDLRNKLKGSTMATNANPNDVRNHSIGFLREWKNELTHKMNEVDAELKRREEELRPVRPEEHHFCFSAQYKTGGKHYEFVAFQPGGGSGRIFLSGEKSPAFRNWEEFTYWLRHNFRWVSDFNGLRLNHKSYASHVGDEL